MCKSSHVEQPHIRHLNSETDRMIKSAQESKKRSDKDASERARERWHHTLEHIRSIVHSPAHYRAPLHIASREHMSSTDCFDGKRVRSGEWEEGTPRTQVKGDEPEDEDLPLISPIMDGRLKDVGRA